MKSLRSNSFAASVIFLCGGATLPLHAGYEIAAAPTAYGPLNGTVFLELGFTEDVIGGSANIIAPLYKGADGKNMFFLNGNWTGLGNGNENASAGLGFRHRFDNDLILGLNAFYDYGDYSGRGYNQFGVGLELLSKWVDFRANGYFPDGGKHSYDRYSKTYNSSTSTQSARTSSASNSVIIDGGEGNPDILQTTTTTTTTTTTNGTKRKVKRTYERLEGAMPGFDLELGGLIPYLDCWMETRIYGGYAWFDDPFGNDINSFNARLEARPVPAMVLNADYKGDSRLVDGQNHWFFSARVEIPFDLGNLARGQSPFAGITEAFTPQGACWQSGAETVHDKDGKKTIIPAEQLMRNRMNEKIVRNWRPTVSRTGYEKVSDSTKVRRTETITTETSQTVTEEPIFVQIDD